MSPHGRSAKKTDLSGLFLLLAGVVVWRVLKTGGPAIPKMMEAAPSSSHT